MAVPPTLPGLAAQLATLQTQVADLTAKVAALQATAAALSESDVASGWAKWRENQNKAGS